MLRQKLPQQYGAERFAAGRAAIRLQNEDSRRGEFLRAIDTSESNCNDWEINFIAGFLGKRALKDIGLDFQWFTPARRKAVDQMIQRYGFRTLRPVSNAQKALQVPQAAAGHCGYLKRDDDTGRQELCNAPAVLKLQNGLELCPDCNQIRERGLAQLRAAKERRLRS